MKEITISDYEKYLYFGYVPRWSEASLDWLNCDFQSEFGKGVDDESWWIREGVKTLKNTMANEIASTDSHAFHILLLSGGLDSRVILGALLEHVPPSQIIIATYGIPGAWDFEIAKFITRRFGLRHELFNLVGESWDIDQLIKAATRLTLPVSVYQSYVRQKINNHFGTECIYWSGFLGDAVGGRSNSSPFYDKLEVVKFIFEKDYPGRMYSDKESWNNIINKILVEIPWDRLNQPKYHLEQQLNFGIVERDDTRPVVIVNGFNFRTPFLNKDWVAFMSNVPYKWLYDKYLYKRIIMECYKELSKLPAKATAGMPLNSSKQKVFFGKAIARIKPYIVRRDPYRSHPRISYINWRESLCHKGPLQETVYTTLESLKKRTIFNNEDIDKWWQEHLSRQKDHTIWIMNLSSLELLIKVGLL